jgi:hypothetical protein
MRDDPDETDPGELDDIELLLFRTRLRLEIVRNPGNVSPELRERYFALNVEVDRRARGEWS